MPGNDILSAQAEILAQIRALADKGVPLAEVAALLGAQKYFSVEKKPRRAPVYRFRVRDFLEEKGYLPRLPQEYLHLGEMVLPPDRREAGETTGEGGGMEKQLFPKTETLLELLSELRIDYLLADGKNDEGVFRSLSYAVFGLLALRKLVMVNNEEGNATFIIHDVDIEWTREALRRYTALKKNELKELFADRLLVVDYPVSEENHRLAWKERMRAALLSENVSETASSRIEKNPSLNQKQNEAKAIERIGIEAAKVLRGQGWMIQNDVATLLGISKLTVSRYGKKHVALHPEWIKEVSRDRSGNISLLYSPDLIKAIKNDLGERVNLEDGWRTIGSLYRELGFAEASLKEMALVHKDVHPEWFKYGVSREGKMRLHCSPELVKILRKQVKRIRKIPLRGRDYLPMRELFKLVGADWKSVEQHIEANRQEYSRFIKWRRSSIGRIVECYHVSLVSVLREKIGPLDPCWHSEKSASESCHIHRKTFRKLVEPLRVVHPAWFRAHKGMRNSLKTAEYFHEDLIKFLVSQRSG
jgi:hypothetical protein